MERPELYYLNSGERYYGNKPRRPYTRPYWEFQAVVAGRIGPKFEHGTAELRENHLWVFEANHPHDWAGEAGLPAEILVFHLTEPDTLLSGQVRDRGGMVDFHLTEPDIAWLREQHHRLRGDYTRPSELTHLRVTEFYSRLTLITLERIGYQVRTKTPSLDSERVDRALYWFRQNVTQHPSVTEAAMAVGVSEVHLRRLFRKELEESPKSAFQRIRMEYVRDALHDPQETVEEVAARAGYADASSLTRAYRSHFGRAPRRG